MIASPKDDLAALDADVADPLHRDVLLQLSNGVGRRSQVARARQCRECLERLVAPTLCGRFGQQRFDVRPSTEAGSRR